MKRTSAGFLQGVTVIIGISALVFMLWEPHLEGRNVNASLFEIYFKDPFLAYVYIGSMPFFVALYQAFNILGYVKLHKTFSQATMNAVRTIKYCGMTLIGFITGAEAYIVLAHRTEDDIAGGVAVGLFLMLISAVIATTATVFEKQVKRGIANEPKNDPTV